MKMNMRRKVKMYFSRNKGSTLIELIVAMGLAGLIVSGSFGIFNYANAVQEKSRVEYDMQASIRLVSEHMNNITRYSTAVFTIPESSFREDNLTDQWSYVGILDGSIVKYQYGDKDGVIGHHKTVIAEPHPDIEYKIVFNKAIDDHQEKIVGYTIQAFIKDRPVELDGDGNPIGHFNIYSQVEALNSIQVIHKGTPADPAVALAYRADPRGETEIEVIYPVAQIAMVLDTSGSMNWKMNGDSTQTETLRRIYFLKQAAKQLVDNFSPSEYPVDISLVPFATTANNPRPFLNVQDDADELKDYIDALDADGGTNTGDGIRRAYHNIVNNRSNPGYAGKIVSDYIIILVDGVTTFATRTGPYSWYPYRTDGLNVPSLSHIFGNGSTLDPQGTAYVDLIGSMVVADGNIKVFVIGFSSVVSNLTSVDDIVDATGAEPKYLAGDVDQLNLVFGEIQKNILNELWYIDGPQF